MPCLRHLALCLALAACAQPGGDQGPLQPQATTGPCTVKRFFLLGFTAVHTEMAIRATGEACSFTVLNPDLQVFPTNSIVTQAAQHGRATTTIISGGRQPLISYGPAPGYTGPDRFTVTIEPGDHAIAVAVVVQPPA